MKKPLLLVKGLVLVGLLAMGCSDNDNDYQCPEAITGELTETETAFTGTWALTSIVAEDAIDLTDDNEDNPSTDIFSQYTECESDITYSFETDRSYTFSYGTTVEGGCENSNSVSGTWGLTGDSLSLVANCFKQATSIGINAEGTQFTTEAIVEYRDVNGSIVSTTIVSTYEK